MKWLLSIAFSCILTLGPPYQVQALTFEQMPKIQALKQWSVQLGEAELIKRRLDRKKVL